MSGRNKKFGEMLTEAIRMIQACTDRPIGIIEEELGDALSKSHKTVQRWRQGYVPDQMLCRELVQELYNRSCGRLPRYWFTTFLHQCQLPDSNLIANQLFAQPPTSITLTLRILPIPHWTRTDIPLVNQQLALDTLRKTWERTKQRRAHAVFIEGEPGVGKTRLVQEFLSQLGHGPLILLPGRADHRKDFYPFRTLTEALYPLIPQWDKLDIPAAVRRELTRIIPVIDDDTTPSVTLDIEQAQARRRWAFYTLLLELSKRTPVILWIDDLQWLDAATLHCVEHLLLQNSRASLLLVGTLRPSEVLAKNAFDKVQTNLERSNQLSKVALRKLNDEECQRLALHVDPISELSAEEWQRHTSGNPLFIIEMASMISEKQNAVPSRIADGIAASVRLRLAYLDATSRRFLNVAAIIGREFNIEWVALVGEFDDDSIDQSLTILTEKQFIQVSGLIGSFTHDLLQGVVYAELQAWTRGRLHKNVADMLVSQRVDASQIAFHYQQAQLWPQASDYLMSAGVVALEKFEIDAACRFLEDAYTISRDYKVALSHEQQAILYSTLGDAYRHSAAWDKSIRQYESLMSLLPSQSSQLMDIYYKLGSIYVQQNRFELAAEWLDSAMLLAQQHNDVPMKSKIAIEYALIAARQGQFEEAMRKAQQSTAVETAKNCNLLAFLHKTDGALQEARHYCERAIHLARRDGHLLDLARAFTNLGVILYAENRWHEAVEANREAIKLNASLGNRHVRAITLCNQSDVLRRLGRRDESLTLAKEATKAGLAIDEPLLKAHSLLCLGSVLHEQNEDGRLHLHNAWALLETHNISELRAETAAMLAREALRRDDLALAASYAELSLVSAEEYGEAEGIGIAKRISARVAFRQANLTRAKTLVEQSIEQLASAEYELALSYLFYVRMFEGALAHQAEILHERAIQLLTDLSIDVDLIDLVP